MFTSCCPAGCVFLKTQYPDMADHLSTAKSPQQMFGAVTKSYFAEKIGVDPDKICCISIMPCVVQKAGGHPLRYVQRGRLRMGAQARGTDVDIVLTTRELARMIRAEHIAADASDRGGL